MLLGIGGIGRGGGGGGCSVVEKSIRPFTAVCVCVFMLKKGLWEEINSVSKQFSNMKEFSD